MYRRIVLAYDGSEMGQQALLGCKEFAELARAELFLVAVVSPAIDLASGEGTFGTADFEESERHHFREELDDGLRRLAELGHRATGEVAYGDTIVEIANYAARVGADLIVVGHRHREGWVNRWWRRSVSKSLIEHAPCNVLIVINR